MDRFLKDRSRVNVNDKDLYNAILTAFHRDRVPSLQKMPQLNDIVVQFKIDIDPELRFFTREKIQELGHGHIDYTVSIDNLSYNSPYLLACFPLLYIYKDKVRVYELFLPNVEEFASSVKSVQQLALRVSHISLLYAVEQYFKSDLNNNEPELRFFSAGVLDKMLRNHDQTKYVFHFLDSDDSGQVQGIRSEYSPARIRPTLMEMIYDETGERYYLSHDQISEKLSRKFFPLLRDIFNRKATEQLYYETVRYLPIRGYSDTSRNDLKLFAENFRRSANARVDISEHKLMYLLEGVIIALERKLVEDQYLPESFLGFVRFGQFLFTKVNSGISKQQMLERHIHSVMGKLLTGLKQVAIDANTKPGSLCFTTQTLNREHFADFKLSPQRFNELVLNYADLSEALAVPFEEHNYVICLYRHIPVIIANAKAQQTADSPIYQAITGQIERINDIITKPDRHSKAQYAEAKETMQQIGVDFFNAYYREKAFLREEETSANPLLRLIDFIVDFIRYGVLRIERPGFDSKAYQKARRSMVEQTNGSAKKETTKESSTQPGTATDKKEGGVSAEEDRRMQIMAQRKRLEALQKQYANEISRTRRVLDRNLDNLNYFPTPFEIQRAAKVSDEAWNSIVNEYFGFETLVANGDPNKTVILPLKYVKHCRQLCRNLQAETQRSLAMNRFVPKSKFTVEDLHDLGRQLHDRMQRPR